MTKKREIIDLAFGSLGLSTYTWNPTPAQRKDAFMRLEAMATQWESMGYRVGYTLGGTEDSETGASDTLNGCFYSNLAVRMAPSFGKTPSPELKQEAKAGRDAMALFVATHQTVQMPSTMPIGAGNKRGYAYQEFFAPTEPLTGNGETIQI